MNRIKKRAVTLLILFSVAGKVYPQQVINPTLEVRREFDKRLLEVEKSALNSSIADSIKSFNLTHHYTTFKKPLKNLYRFTPISAINIKGEEPSQGQLLSLELGANFPFSPFGSLFISPIRRSSRFTMPLVIQHSGYYASLPRFDYIENSFNKRADRVYSPHSISNFSLLPKLRWSSGEATLHLGYRRGAHTLYGFGNDAHIDVTPKLMRDSLLNRSDILKIEAAIVSKFKESIPFNYGARTTLSSLNFRELHPLWLSLEEGVLPYSMGSTSITERSLELHLWGGLKFKNHNRVDISALFNTNGISSLEQLRQNFELAPSYSFQKRGWLLTLGLKFNRSWNNHATAFNIYLKGLAQREIVKRSLWLYGSIDGKNHLNSLQGMVLKTAWISPKIEIKDSEQPLELRVGVKGLLARAISFNIFAGYDQFVNQLHLYSNSSISNSSGVPLNSIDALYKNQLSFLVGATLSYEGEPLKLNISTKLAAYRDQYKNWEEHFNYPKATLNAFAQYSIKRRLFVSSQIEYSGAVPMLVNRSPSFEPLFEVREAPSYLKIDLELSYILNRRSTLFISINNLLNSTIIEHGAYAQQSINGGVGFRYSL